MKRSEWITVAVALVMILIFACIHQARVAEDDSGRVVKVGFVYAGDESTPYSYNFIRAQRALETAYGEQAEILAVSNLPESEAEETLRELARSGCEIIFSNSVEYEGAMLAAAADHPEVQFCQGAAFDANTEGDPENYHTFMGEIYQGRYVSGVVAGLKLRELIEAGTITEAKAKVGYVAAIPCAEVISGYTAFILGVRSVVPSAVMTVRYTNTWTSYDLEKKAAEALLAEGCVVLSQHSDTIGPAVACEAEAEKRPVYIVGYNQSMMDVAPTTALVSCRINWSPYVLAAFEAVLAHESVEKHLKAHTHGNDASAGFQREWVQMLELNDYIAAPGTRQAMEETIADLHSGRVQIFKGPYTGVNFEDPTDTVDLTNGYTENRHSSAPSFCYILEGIVTIRGN